ncbi:MAG TPA: S41 family peptidase [Labilithrix sp.]
MKRSLDFVVVFSLLAACSQASPATDPAPAQGSVARAPETRSDMPEPQDDDTPAEAFGDGARAFAKVKESLLQNYYAEGLTEDDVYRAATAGMLERLDPKMKKWNKLLAPREIAELRNDLKGEVVGIGVSIKLDPHTGYAEVLAALPGSPAEKAGLVSGDMIVTVNGKLYKGMRLRDVVADIRGKAGEPVKVSVLRGAEMKTFDVVRGRVAYDRPSSLVFADHTGYLRIPGFNEQTPGAARAELESLEKQGATALVLDLRANPGGSFDAAVASAELFLPERAPIVTLKRRGKPEEKNLARGGAILANVPLAVLVDGATASGAEFVTAALAEDRHARVVGEPTKGKWSVQTIDELSNGWAFKYTVSLFKTPSGKSYEGTGLAPDVEVAMDERVLARANAAATPEERLDLDMQLRTAKGLLVGSARATPAR